MDMQVVWPQSSVCPLSQGPSNVWVENQGHVGCAGAASWATQAPQHTGHPCLHQVTKTVKTVTTRTVRQVPVGPDGLPLLDGGPPLGSFPDGPLDRHFLLRGGGPAATLSRAYLSSGGSFTDGPEPRDVPSYGSLSRGLGMRPLRGGPLGPDPGNGCFTLPGRREAFPVGPEPVTPAGHSQPERFQAESYGLEDDTRSLAADDEGGPELESDYGTATRKRPDYGRVLRTR